MSARGDAVRKAATLIQDHGLAVGEMHNLATDSYCLNGAMNFVKKENREEAHRLASEVAFRLVKLGIAPRGRYWNPLQHASGIKDAGVEIYDLLGVASAAGWSNACGHLGHADEVIHGLKLVAESFDLEDEA